MNWVQIYNDQMTMAARHAAARGISGAVIKAFLKGAGKNLVQFKDKDDLKEMIYSTVKLKTKSIWAIRVQTGSW